MDKIYIVMDFVEHDLKALMETMTQAFLAGNMTILKTFTKQFYVRASCFHVLLSWQSRRTVHVIVSEYYMFLLGEIKTIMIQLLRAVNHLHDNWILHRDIKTSNLLLSNKGILKVH